LGYIASLVSKKKKKRKEKKKERKKCCWKADGKGSIITFRGKTSRVSVENLRVPDVDLTRL
jgi:hypothetical protein